jgi:hypothetical protein
VIQACAILVTLGGIYFLSRKEQNKVSMYLMISTIGCLIVNSCYLLLIRSTTPAEGLLAMRLESIGTALLYFFLHWFILEYLKIRHARWIMMVWAVIECLNCVLFWNEKTMHLVLYELIFLVRQKLLRLFLRLLHLQIRLILSKCFVVRWEIEILFLRLSLYNFEFQKLLHLLAIR